MYHTHMYTVMAVSRLFAANFLVFLHTVIWKDFTKGFRHWSYLWVIEAFIFISKGMLWLFSTNFCSFVFLSDDSKVEKTFAHSMGGVHDLRVKRRIFDPWFKTQLRWHLWALIQVSIDILLSWVLIKDSRVQYESTKMYHLANCLDRGGGWGVFDLWHCSPANIALTVKKTKKVGTTTVAWNACITLVTYLDT